MDLAKNNDDSIKSNDEIKCILKELQMRLSKTEELTSNVTKDSFYILNKLNDLDTKTNDIKNNSDKMESKFNNKNMKTDDQSNTK